MIQKDSSHKIAQIELHNLFANEFGRQSFGIMLEEIHAAGEDASYEVVMENMAKRVASAPRSSHFDYELQPRDNIVKYLAGQYSQYVEELVSLATTLPPLVSQCRLSAVIPVASRQEGLTVYQGLKCYAEQDLDPQSFEIVVYENIKQGTTLADDFTSKELERFKADYPYLNLVHLYEELPSSECTIGYLRKRANDLVLQRYVNRGEFSRDHILLRADIDTLGLHRDFLANYIEKFDRYPHTDAFCGKLDVALEHCASCPLLYFGQQFPAILLRLLREDGSPHGFRSGANLAYRASAYARIGGYRATCELTEDVEFDDLLMYSREGSKKHVAIQFAGPASQLFTSGRRGAEALAHGYAPVQQWSKEETQFLDENVEIRAKEIRPDPEIFFRRLCEPDLADKIEMIINNTLPYYYSLGDKEDYTKERIVRALDSFGIKAAFLPGGEVEVLNISGFHYKMRKFLENWEKLRERRLGISHEE